MLEILTGVVFVLVASVTLTAGLAVSSGRARALQRLAPQPKLVKPFLPSPALVWRELVDRLGSVVPASPKDLPLLKCRLIQAGWRNPEATRYFQGARVVAITVFALLALATG